MRKQLRRLHSSVPARSLFSQQGRNEGAFISQTDFTMTRARGTLAAAAKSESPLTVRGPSLSLVFSSKFMALLKVACVMLPLQLKVTPAVDAWGEQYYHRCCIQRLLRQSFSKFAFELFVLSRRSRQRCVAAADTISPAFNRLRHRDRSATA